jgi:hypothetical protein
MDDFIPVQTKLFLVDSAKHSTSKQAKKEKPKRANKQNKQKTNKQGPI